MNTLRLSLIAVLLIAFVGCETSDDVANPDASLRPQDTAGDSVDDDAFVPVGEPEWQLVDVGQGTATGFAGIHGVSSGASYVTAVVGTDASVFVYDSTTDTWDPRPVGEARLLNAVWVEDFDTVYVGGDSGILRRWDHEAGLEGDWVEERIPDLGDLAEDVEILDMWGDRASGQFVCGNNGFIGKWDPVGEVWRPEFFPGADATQGRKLESIWGGGPDDVWVAGNRIIAHYDGVDWDITSFEEEGEFFHGIWVASSGTVYAVTDGGSIWTLDRPNGASEWTKETPVRMAQLDTWGVGDDVFSVGWISTMLHLVDGSWDVVDLKTKPSTPQDLQIPGNLTLEGLWGTSADNLYVISDEGHVIRWGAVPVGQ